MEAKEKDPTKAKGVAVLEKADGATRQALMATNSNATTAEARITLNEIAPMMSLQANGFLASREPCPPLRNNLDSAWVI